MKLDAEQASALDHRREGLGVCGRRDRLVGDLRGVRVGEVGLGAARHAGKQSGWLAHVERVPPYVRNFQGRRQTATAAANQAESRNVRILVAAFEQPLL